MHQNLYAVLQELGLPSEEAAGILTAMQSTAYDWLLLSIIESLPLERVTEFDALIARQAGPDEITPCLRAAIPNLDQHLQERLQVFQDEIVTTVRDIDRAEQESQPRDHHQATPPTIVEEPPKEPQPEATDKKSLEKKLYELGKTFKAAVKKGDFGEAAKLMQERKKLVEKINQL